MIPFLPLVLGGAMYGVGAAMNQNAQAAANQMSWQQFKYAADQQDYYAQHGIQVRADDARRAGVNVSTALGAPSMSIGTPAGGGVVPETGLGDAMGNLGQNIFSMATQQQERNELYDAQIRNANLQNDLLEHQISILKNPARQTSLPSPAGNVVPGQGNSGSIVIRPSEVVASAAGDRSQEPGAINEIHFSRGAKGGFHPIMSDDFKKRSEDSLLPEAEWFVRNRLMNWSSGGKPPQVRLGPGMHWEWDIGDQSWKQIPNKIDSDSNVAERIRRKFKIP